MKRKLSSSLIAPVAITGILRIDLRRWRRIAAGVGILLASVWTVGTLPANAAEQAAARDFNRISDISDSQVFVNYTSPLGFSAEVPEGWERSEDHNTVRFSDKSRALTFSISSADKAPTVTSVKQEEAVELLNTGRGLKIHAVKSLSLHSGPAVVIEYSYNGALDLMTDKLTRVEGTRYFLFHQGKLAVIDLITPYGTENVDQWNFISNSFRWG